MKRNGIVRRYHQARLEETIRIAMNDLSGVGSICVSEESSKLSDNHARISVAFSLQEGEWDNTNVGIEFVLEQWNRNNYVVLPAAVYDGNRFEAREIAYSPKLNQQQDIGKDIPTIITDVPRLDKNNKCSRIQLLSGDMSEPGIGIFIPDENKAIWLITKQIEGANTYGFEIEEKEDKASIIIAIPGIRDTYKYRMCTTKDHSTDTGIVLNTEPITLSIDCFEEKCANLVEFYDMYKQVREELYDVTNDVNHMPYSHAIGILKEKHNRENWVEEYGYYSVGMRSNFLENWSIGWTGGFPTLYVLARCGDRNVIERINRNFDYVFPKGQTPGGLLWDCGEYGKWYGGDIRREHTKNWHLIRKSGDALYYIVLLFEWYEKKQRSDGLKEAWINGTEKLADKLVAIYEQYGQLGQFVHNETGEVIVGGSSSSATVPAALVKAYDYFGKEKYLNCACKLANQLYNDFIGKGITTGGPGDALQNPDSESGFAFVISFMELYNCTKEEGWLQKAKAAANLFATWVVPYEFQFPADSLFGRLKINTRGAVYANTQNKHASPGICTSSGLALLKLFRATGEEFYLHLLQGTAHNITQYLSCKERPIGDLKEGWMNERVNMSDWLEPVGEIFTGSTWAEVACMLTIVELPGIYVVPDSNLVVAFDNINCQLSKVKGGYQLLLQNDTKYDAVVHVYSESQEECKELWQEDWLSKCKMVYVPVNQSVTLLLENK